MASSGLGIREDGGHLVVPLRGELDATDAAVAPAALADATAVSQLVVADLAAVEFTQCRLLGVLARARAQGHRSGEDLLLAAPTPECGGSLT